MIIIDKNLKIIAMEHWKYSYDDYYQTFTNNQISV